MDTSHRRRTRRGASTPIALLAMLLSTIALAACGGDEGDVRELAEQLVESDPAVCDNVTGDFLEAIGSTKERCRKSAEGADDDDKDGEVKEVKVEGDSASAVVDQEGRSTVKFVKRDGEWLLNGLEVQQAPAPKQSDEIHARAAAQALLIVVEKEQGGVICTLLDEDYARELTGAEKFDFARCKKDFEQGGFGELPGTLRGAEVKSVAVKGGGETATVTLSNGTVLSLKRDGERYRVAGVGTR